MTAKSPTHGPPSNATIAGLLRRYAAALVLEGVDRFKVNAYRRAADTLGTLQVSAAELVSKGSDLKELPGIGKAISAAVEEIIRTGKMPQLDRAVSHLSPALLELVEWPALDPKQVQRIYKKLSIGSIEELRASLKSGAIRQAVGARMEYHVRTGLALRPRILLWAASKIASRIEEFLQAIPGVKRVAVTGSFRRKQETVGDINFLVAGLAASELFRHVSRFGGIESEESRGRHHRLYKLSNGVVFSVLWTRLDAWGETLLRSTGSMAHIEDLQAIADKTSIDLSAKGLRATGIDPSEEASVYRGLGLSFIEPELREGSGEILAAKRNRLPRLLVVEDLKGDLHMHTTASDGANSLEEMAQAAKDRGYEYIAITDHSQSLKITNGLTEKRLREQIARIDRLNERLKGFRILKSAEVDILEDGALDYSNSMLKELDLTICSIHSRFGLNKQDQTDRIRRAMDNPYFNILGHATGRLLLKREGYEVEIDALIQHAKVNGCFFEINSSPDRLDLSAEHARLAKAAGVKIAINTDAHHIRELNFIAAGVNQARRAWLEAADLLNALPLQDLLAALHR